MWYWLIFDSCANLRRRLTVVRHTVEAGVRRFAGRVGAPGQVAREQQRADARDVSLERQRQQIELQLDVLVERLRHTHRHFDVLWRNRRCLDGNLQAPLDLLHLLRVFVEPQTIARAQVAAQA
jgi:hypothetical protein